MTVHDYAAPPQHRSAAPVWADLGALSANTRTVALGLEGLESSARASAQDAVDLSGVTGLAVLAARTVSARAAEALRAVSQAHGVVALLSGVAERVRDLAESAALVGVDPDRVADAAVFADLTAQAGTVVGTRIDEATEAAEELVAEVNELERLLLAAENNQVVSAQALNDQADVVARLHVHAQRAASTAWDRALVVGGVREDG